MDDIRRHIEAHAPDHIEVLKRLCRQPSVSAHKTGLSEMAELCAQTLRDYGLQASLLPIPGAPPGVYGELKGRSPKTLLFYDHYDVQPAEPLDLWESPPFEPAVRDGRLYARGVADNKGNFVARLAAIKTYLDLHGHLPVSVKFFLEGQEEIGSPSLAPFVKSHTELLAADACIWESGGVNWAGQPHITLGLKGILYVELTATGATRDLHSAMATAVVNPLWRLVWALNTLKGSDEHIQINGHYQDVRPPTPAELQLISEMPSEEEETKSNLGLSGFLLGLTGADLRVRQLFAPTCTICGIWGGYTGEGSKTVLPCVARAKIDFRLVPDMDPADILAKLRRHLDSKGFGDIAITTLDAGERAWRTPLDDPFVRTVVDAAREAYEMEPVVSPTMTGSGPMYPFGAYLGVPIASSGTSYPDSRVHAPNENIRLADFVTGIRHVAAIMAKMAG